MSSSARHHQHRSGIVSALDQEWCELVRCCSGVVITWAERHPVLAQCESLDEVLTVAKLQSDAALAVLVAEVSAGDRLAGRVVLQALIGRLVRMAQRDPRSGIDDYLAALWQVINSYPLSRRPVRIAANLSMDTLKTVSRERRWPGRGDVRLWPTPELFEDRMVPAGLDGSPIGSAPLVDVEAQRVLEASSLLQLIDGPDVALLRSIYADGLTGAQAARQFRLNVGTVRVRCSKAVRRLAAHAVELAEAA
jgi:DNA-directed RNA polymerase specialized sigma24 family protein